MNIKLLYSNPKSAFGLCSSFFKRAASAETKEFQVCVGLCILTSSLPKFVVRLSRDFFYS